MAVFLRQNPTSPNVAYTKLLYVVEGSTSINQPQHKFVCKITDTQGNTTYLRQQANNANSAVFDVSIPVRGWLKPDNLFDDYGKTFAFTSSADDSDFNSYDRITVAFGEEYGTSISSSVTMYDGKGNVGQPAVSASNNGAIQVFRGTKQGSGPWNIAYFQPTPLVTASALPVSSSLSGSINSYLYETGGSLSSSFADTNLLITSSVTESRLQTTNISASMPFDQGDQLIHVEVYSTALSSSNFTYQLSIADLTTNQTIYSVSGVTGSAGPGTKVLISHDFTASLDHLYGVNAGGAFTGSWVIPTITPFYSASNNEVYRNTTYPLFPGNYINSGSESANGFEIISNTASQAVYGDVLEAYPTSQSFVANLPSNIGPPNLHEPRVQSWNFNMSKGEIGWLDDLTLSNYPQAFGDNVDPGAGQPAVVVNDDQLKTKAYRPIAQGDYAWLSWFNYSGSLANPTVDPLIGKVYLALSSYTSSNDVGLGVGSVTFSTASYSVNNIQTPPLFASSGSNSADVPLCTIPIGPANIRTIVTGSLNLSTWGNNETITNRPWNYMSIQFRGYVRNNDGSVGSRDLSKAYYRDEPCEGETRFNFCFINYYGVWDNIAFNTPAVNRNTNIDERVEFTNSETDYGGNTSIYDVYARGIEQYYLSQDDEFEITTPFIQDNNSGGPDGAFTKANFYQELIMSPNVLLQRGSELVPIVITNSEFRYKTNQRAQKGFVVTIRFRYSNKRRSRT